MDAKQISYDEAIRRGIAHPEGLMGRYRNPAADPNSPSASDEHFREGVAQAGQIGIDPLVQLQNMMGMKDQQLSQLDAENGKLRSENQQLRNEALMLYRTVYNSDPR